MPQQLAYAAGATPSGRDAGALPVRWWIFLAGLLGFLIAVTILTYALARSREMLTLHSLAEADAISFTKRLQSEIDDQLRVLRRMKWSYLSGRYKNPEDLQQAATDYQKQNSLCLEIGLANADGHVDWVWPTQGAQIPVELGTHEEWEAALKASRTNARDIAAVWLDKKTNPQFLGLVMPLGLGDEGHNVPVLVARVNPRPLLDSVIDGRIRGNHSMEVSDGTLTFLKVGVATKPRHWEEQLARFANRYWQIRLWPTGGLVATRMRLDTWILIGGICASCLITLAVYVTLKIRARHLRHVEAHMAALEWLNQISSAISGKLGSGKEIMQQLAEAARTLMGMSRSIFTLVDPQHYCMRTFASSGDIPPGAPPIFPLEQMPVMRRCLISGDVLFSEDTSEMTEPVNRDMIKAYDSGSMILIPLRVEDRSIGMMALSDSKPRKFTDADRRLARLLSSQATVILANNRLYEQTRASLEQQKQLHEQAGHDAQAKAILLRELHHRVKNNLAGIVGLLSMHEPDLPDSARQWLGRVTERIQTMARAHDLFSGGIERVTLQQLVQQVLPSLSVLTPPGVAVKVNLGELDISFDTSRAVSLAMALHELCTNALVHGLDGKGTLTISARRNDDSAEIEVSDDGQGEEWIDEAQAAGDGQRSETAPWNAPSTATAVARGTGLFLVRELVGRELRGALRLSRRGGGGTVATISLPIGSGL